MLPHPPWQLMEVNGQLNCLAALSLVRDFNDHLVGGWVDFTASPDIGEEKNLLFLLEIKPQFLSCPALTLHAVFPYSGFIKSLLYYSG